jgi:hypothetical protein
MTAAVASMVLVLMVQPPHDALILLASDRCWLARCMAALADPAPERFPLDARYPAITR